MDRAGLLSTYKSRAAAVGQSAATTATTTAEAASQGKEPKLLLDAWLCSGG